ncbi:MAG: hypothetical protein JXA41_01415 [Deltaproteobacteria bacterium]|nr:hypothetical protein [Deltaproteobacteria bacterium]
MNGITNPRKKKRWTGVILFMVLSAAFVAPQTAGAAVIIKIGSDVTVEKERTVDHVIAVGGQITVYGRIVEHVVAIGGSVVLGSTAEIGGNVITVGGVIVRGRGAEVQGHMTQINATELAGSIKSLLKSEREGWHWVSAVLSFLVFIGFSLLALLMTVLFPDSIRQIADIMQQNTFKVFLSGIFGLIMIVPLAVLLAVSVVGIVLIPLEMILVACAVLVGVTALSQLVGRRISSLMKKSRRGIIGETLLGLLILWLIGWLPYVGVMLKAFVLILALGGVLVNLFAAKAGMNSSSGESKNILP